MIYKGEQLAIFGGGGHARSVIATFLEAVPKSIISVYDDNTSAELKLAQENIQTNEGGQDKFYKDLKSGIPFFIAIGDNQLRKKITSHALKYSNKLVSIVSIKAHVLRPNQIGNGVFIGSNTYIGPNASVGDSTIINAGAIIEHDCIIGECVHIAPGTVICGGCSIGDLSFLGAGSTVTPNVKISSFSFLKANSLKSSDI